MLTLEKLRTYEAFNGDLDGWVRASTGEQRSFMSDADWYLIDALLTDIATADSGLASPTFMHEVENTLGTSTADDATRDALRALSRQRGGETT
ncbi:MAG: hypothetical protein GC183_14720 [Thiobacillus sp.]|nr:hypothetical protein [Thiobacillus sp.]